MSQRLPSDSATIYARQVKSGAIPACSFVKLACKRHLEDWKSRKRTGLIWREDEVVKVVNFFSDVLRHTKGAMAGQPFNLAPWQVFIIGNIFGWQRNGRRRFRTAYIEVPRKNGKSTLAAGVGLKLAFVDEEAGAEVYVAATKRDQAKIVWEQARDMVKASPDLRPLIQSFVLNLHNSVTGQKFEPLGADRNTMDGLNIHGVIIDELHAHPKRNLWDVLNTATGARHQPLIFAITTAGYDRGSICWEQHAYAEQLLKGLVEDETYFAFMSTLDEGDDWKSPAAWVKANPNLGVSLYEETIKNECEHAIAVPGAQNAFRRLHLNEWTEQADRWLSIEQWDEAEPGPSPDDLEGEACYAGMDLASTTDIAAFELWFPHEEGGGTALSCFWVPKDNMQRRADKDRVPYPQWVREGLIEATEGNVIDYDVIRARVNELGEKYEIREIAFDRWNSTQLQTQLAGDGFTVFPFGQGFRSMSAPTKEIERLVLERKLRHNRNPVLRWMASNVAVKQDPAGNLKIDRASSFEKVDGIIALAMAIGRWMVQPGQVASIYETEGLML